MIFYDVDALNAKFATITLSYKNAANQTVNLPASQVLVENSPATDLDETAPWVRWSIAPGESKPKITGTPVTYLSLGNAYLQVFIPKDMGATIAQDIIESFHAAFRNWRSADKKLKIVGVGQIKVPNKDFYQVNASIKYESLRS